MKFVCPQHEVKLEGQTCKAKTGGREQGPALFLQTTRCFNADAKRGPGCSTDPSAWVENGFRNRGAQGIFLFLCLKAARAASRA